MEKEEEIKGKNVQSTVYRKKKEFVILFMNQRFGCVVWGKDCGFGKYPEQQ